MDSIVEQYIHKAFEHAKQLQNRITTLKVLQHCEHTKVL